MTRYLPQLRDILVRFSPTAIVFAVLFVVSISATSATAQTLADIDKPPGAAADVDKPLGAAEPKADLKTSLNSLLTLRQNEVTRLEKQQGQSKDLYRDGLISRLEFENGEKALTDARTKVEETTKQIALAEQPVAAATDNLVSDSLGGFTAWSTGNSKVDSLIRYYGTQHGVDPYLIFCLMSQESGFSANVTSYKGAMGLMQLMPGTAARYGVTNPYDISQSISGGTRYLKDLLKMFNGRVDLALAGYNAGEGAVMKYGNTVPPYSETRNYVKLILQRYTKKKVS